jgi:hypothetical protein
MFTVEIEGLDDLENDWKSASDELVRGLRAGVARSVEEGAREAKATHRFQNRTGDAEASIRPITLSTNPESIVSEVICDVPYAQILDGGSRPHEITPRGRWLAWENPDAQGDWRFARKVNHPGTKPDPFFKNGFRRASVVVLFDAEIAADKLVTMMDPWLI